MNSNRKIVDCTDVDLDAVYNEFMNKIKIETVQKAKNRTVFFLKKADNIERGDTSNG